MPKITISYPQIVFPQIEVEVTEEQLETLHNQDNEVDFIWNRMSQDDQDWCPGGKKGLSNAIDMEYCGVETSKQS